ncbi:MAG: hypothetical protein AAGJ29_08290 [Pseudomonadota bacterium]
MKKRLSAILAGVTLVIVAACNTVQGIGSDLEAAGKGLRETSESVEDNLTDEP